MNDLRYATSGPITRVESSDLRDSCVAWLRRTYPDLWDFSINVWISPKQLPQELLVGMDQQGMYVSPSLTLTLPQGKQDNSVCESIQIVQLVRLALSKVGDVLRVAGEPPVIPYTEEERSWLASHDDPRVKLGEMPVEYVDKRLPDRAPEPETFRAFDAWSLLSGRDGDAVTRLREALDEVPSDWQEDAKAALRGVVDSWFERRAPVTGGCITDSEAMLAAWVMSQGKETWEKVLADPEWLSANGLEEGMDDGAAEQILTLIQWTGIAG